MPKRSAEDHLSGPTAKVAANLPWPDIPGIKTEDEVNGDRSQFNYRAMANSLRNIKNFTRAAPTVVTPDVRNITDVLEEPVVPGRDFTLLGHRVIENKYTWNIKDNSTPRQSESVARRIGMTMIKLFKRWKLPWSDGPGCKTTILFVRVCHSLVVHGGLHVYLPRVRCKARRGDETEYLVTIPFLDRTTGSRESIEIRATPKIVEAADIPTTPPNPVVAPIVPTTIPDRSFRRDHEKAVKFCQSMAFVFTDTVTTASDIEALRDMYAQSFGTERKGVYRGEPLFVHSDAQHEHKYIASKAVRDDLGGIVPHRIIIRSPNAARGLAAIDAATACYLETGDVRQALLVMAEAADMINDEIRAGKPPCNASRDIDLTANAHLEGHGRYSPDLPSVDGIFSFFECNDKLRYHCEGNVAVTALAINLMKHTHAPAMLDHISEFVRSNKTEEDTLKILSKTTNTALIRIKVPYKLRSRAGRSLNKQRIRKDIREWITDRPTPSDAKMFSTARLRVHGWLKLGNAKRWTAQDRQRLMKVVVEIEHEFKIHLPRGQDGSIDTVDTLFLEMIYQALDPAYTEFLGLPIVAWMRHPLCLAIAHKVHKRQMRTGWTSEHPTCLSERDEAKNNILIETQVSNFLKHDFPVSAYPRLIAMVKDIRISKALHDPGIEFEDAFM
ncbi:unnamed protein product [Aureobasidium pullulans]|nr:unnamed protein product [Aureobasidium pullulans]